MKPEDLAEEHWKFLEKWFHIIFVDAFKHGYKHAKENIEVLRIQREVKKEQEKCQ